MQTSNRKRRSLAKAILMAAVLGLAFPGFSGAAQCGPISGCHFMVWIACGFPNVCNGCPANMCVYQCGGQLLEIPTQCCSCPT